MKKRHLSVMHGVIPALLLIGLLFSCENPTPSTTDAAPGIPTNVSLTPGDTQVTATWVAPENTGLIDGNNTPGIITGYTVYYSTAEGLTKDNAEGSKDAGATDTEIVVDNLINGTTYYFLVTATNATGEGEPSEIASVTVPSYTVGNTGPAGGIVFYDKGSYSNGWRYLEAATTDQSTGIESGIEWGGYETEVGGTSTAIGSGKANTEAIVNKLGSGSYAARICYDLVLGGYDDWFLPSKDELNELYLQKNTVGGFELYYYWSSSGNSSTEAWLQYFGSGDQNYYYKDDDNHVRSVRAF